MSSILSPIAKPIAWVLAAVYSVIPNFGVAIIGLSLLWMIIIAPLTLKSTRSMLAMQALQPEIKRLQDKHRGDKQAFAQAQMDLFRERKVSPLSSCLPSILPLPVFIALFRVIDGLSHTTTINHVKTATPKYLNSHTAMYHAILAAHGKINAFGLNLAENAFSHHSSVVAAIPFFVLLLIMIGTSYLQTAMMMNRNQAATQNPQMKYMKYLPLVFGIVCARFPAGVVLYYAISNVCRIGQQYAMYRWDPKVKALVGEEVRDVEARTRDIDRAAGYTPDYDDYDDDNGPAVQPRPSFRELLAQSRSSSPAKDPKAGNSAKPNSTKPSPTKPSPAKPSASKDRPGSVKANRNRNGTASPAARPSRARNTGANGVGSVKRPSSGTNGTGSTNGAGSTNDAGATNGKAPTNGKAGTNGSASPNGKNGSAATGANGANGANGKAVSARRTRDAAPKAAGSAAGTNGKSNGTPRPGPAAAGAAGRNGTSPPSPRTRRRRGR